MALDQTRIDALRDRPLGDMKNFIDGDWRSSAGGDRIDVTSPGTGAPIATLIDSSEADVPH